MHLRDGYYKARSGQPWPPGGRRVAFRRGAPSSQRRQWPRQHAASQDSARPAPPPLQEALLLKKPLHLTCDGGGQARICSPARYAMMVAGRGCLLENLVLKAHQASAALGGP